MCSDEIKKEEGGERLRNYVAFSLVNSMSKIKKGGSV
jgi:hypothetical protein